MDLVGFLLARLAEDQAVADAALGKWLRGDSPEALELVQHFTVRRLLAECAARRRIIANHAHELRTEPHDGGRTYMECETCFEAHWYVALGGWCFTLRAMALPYADHAGYRREWAP